MRISHAIKGVKEIEKKFKNFERDCKAGQIRAVQDSIFLIDKTAKELIQDNGDGTAQIRYSSSGAKRVVAVSNPGDPPNTDTGRLVQSIKFDFQDGGLTGRVGTNLKYGAWLEFGTKNMKARPWLSTAVSMTAKQVADIFFKRIQEVIKGAGK